MTNKLNVQQPLSAKTAIPTTKPKPKGSTGTDKQVCRFFQKPDGCTNGDNCQYAHPRTNGKCLRCGSESHTLQACADPRQQQSSRSISVKPTLKKTYAKPEGRAADAQGSNACLRHVRYLTYLFPLADAPPSVAHTSTSTHRRRHTHTHTQKQQKDPPTHSRTATAEHPHT